MSNNEDLKARLRMIRTLAAGFNYWNSNLQEASEIIHTIREIADGADIEVTND